MVIRLVGILTALSLLLTWSGAGRLLHEQLEHAHHATVADPEGTAIDAPADHEPAQPKPSHDTHCSVCPTLLHLAAVATIATFVLTFAADATPHCFNAIEAPAQVELSTPRSSRGPPLIA